MGEVGFSFFKNIMCIVCLFLVPPQIKKKAGNTIQESKSKSNFTFYIFYSW